MDMAAIATAARPRSPDLMAAGIADRLQLRPQQLHKELRRRRDRLAAHRQDTDRNRLPRHHRPGGDGVGTAALPGPFVDRIEERRVGNEGGGRVKTRWWP